MIAFSLENMNSGSRVLEELKQSVWEWRGLLNFTSALALCTNTTVNNLFTKFTWVTICE